MIARWNPGLRPFVCLRDDMDRLFGRVFEGFPHLQVGGNAQRAFPAMNIWEDQNNIFAEAELPGIKMEDIELSVVANELTLSGERKQDDAIEGNYHCQERGVGTFTRVIQLPLDIDTQDVEATLQNGVLLITLPKTAAARPRRVEVRTAPE